MKILALECESFEFVCVRPSVPEAGEPLEMTRRFQECMLLLVCVESGDELLVSRASKSIRRVVRNSGCSTVVVNAFAHLSSNLANASVSQGVIIELASRARASPGVNVVYETPFGWQKEMAIKAKADTWSQRFISV